MYDSPELETSMSTEKMSSKRGIHQQGKPEVVSLIFWLLICGSRGSYNHIKAYMHCCDLGY